MQSSRIQGSSKLQFLLNQLSNGYVKQQIIHIHCSCQICVNDVKPIPIPQQPRETSPNQISIPPSQSLLFILKKCVNYRGVIIIPEIIFLQEGMLFYSNQYGKLRMKDKVTNQEAKKFFDERKIKTKFSKGLQKQKENYVLVYKSGTQQLMTESFFNKIIVKRKNDPFWQEAVLSYKLPEPSQGQNIVKCYYYKRTKSGSKKMIPIMERIMYQIDNQQQKQLNKEEGFKNTSMLTMGQNMLNSMQNSANYGNNSLQMSQFSKIPLQQSFLLQKQMTSTIYKAQQKSKLKGYSIKTMIEQIVAYLQVSSKTRVLEIQVQYSQTLLQPIITCIKKLIVCDVAVEQECYLHDRYNSLEIIGIKELTELKKKLDMKDEQTLWNVCTDILNSCLQLRKIKLKIENYEKPSKQNLKLIFQKFFPDFSPYQMFQNINWKNQLPKFMQNSRKAINKIIEQDQGISILKRHNIVFYRTFK